VIFGLRLLPAADDDVDDVAAYIARRSPDQAVRFYDAVNATYKLILEAPARGALYGLTHPRLRDIRKRAVLGFPKHLVFYRIDADMVEVVRVLHGARDLSGVFAQMMEEEPG
jgi:toxin ParE1/3/4